jgi:hypothetical protein
MTFLILFIAAIWAGAQNALAGGGATSQMADRGGLRVRGHRGGVIGGHLVRIANERLLKFLVVLIGVALTIGLFIRGA